MERVPEYWDWLVHMGTNDNIKIVQEIYEELKDGDDDLAAWTKQDEVESALRMEEFVDVTLVREATNSGYASDLRDDELEKLGRDPFLIAYALADHGNRSIVTTEVSKPKRNRGNRHIPDVCTDLSVPCINPFELTTELDFRTDWNQ